MVNQKDKWQLDCSKLSERGAHLLQSGLWSDCTFVVKGHDADVEVPGHKLVLAMASPVLAALVYGGIPCGDRINIEDIKSVEFQAMLKYIYMDEISISSFNMALDLYYAADKYMLPHLVKECSTYISSHLSPENACRAYELASLFDDTMLMDNCLKVIQSNTKEVLNNDSFLEIDMKTMVKVFTLEQMNIESEIDLVEAAARYLKALENTEEKEISTETSSNMEDDTASSQSTKNTSTETKIDTQLTVRHALKQIRFLTLTPKRFTESHSILSRPGMLSELEFLAVLMNISCATSDVPMPDGFSVSRQHRNVIRFGKQPSGFSFGQQPSGFSFGQQQGGGIFGQQQSGSGFGLPQSRKY